MIETNAAMVSRKKRSLWIQMKRRKLLYLLLLLPMVHLLIFNYYPMYGVLIAFKNYRYIDGILGSPWNNFEHFKQLFTGFYFKRVLSNTIIISFYRIAFGFPAPIILALLLNEVRKPRFKKVTQSILYLPYFMSWVILAAVIREVLSPSRGIIAYFFTLFGSKPINFLTTPSLFRGLLVTTEIWKDAGWSAIVYLAAIATVDPTLYEAASMDGATRFQKGIYITIPTIMPVILILFILRMGSLLSAGFDQIFNLYNPLVYSVADIIDTYVYRIGIIEARYDFATAVGLFKNVVGFILLMGTNWIVKKFSEHGGIW